MGYTFRDWLQDLWATIYPPAGHARLMQDFEDTLEARRRQWEDKVKSAGSGIFYTPRKRKNSDVEQP